MTVRLITQRSVVQIHPPQPTNLLNRKAQHSRCWAFFLFTACSSVQNSPKFICNSAFVCRDHVRVAHRGLRVSMTKPILPNRHGCADLVQQGCVSVPESMEATLRDTQLLQQWVKLPLADQTVIPGRTVLCREHKPASFGRQAFQEYPRCAAQFRRDRKTAIAFAISPSEFGLATRFVRRK